MRGIRWLSMGDIWTVIDQLTRATAQELGEENDLGTWPAVKYLGSLRALNSVRKKVGLGPLDISMTKEVVENEHVEDRNQEPGG